MRREEAAQQRRSELGFFFVILPNYLLTQSLQCTDAHTQKSLLNYKAALKQDPVRHNGIFSLGGNSPVSAAAVGVVGFTSGKERRKECARMNGPSAECEESGPVGQFAFFAIFLALAEPGWPTTAGKPSTGSAGLAMSVQDHKK